MSLTFNYRHLYYFWVVAQEGGLVRAAARLDMAVQTVSAQVRDLEKALGYALLKPAGRGVALTEAGVAAQRQAARIFELGEALPALVREASEQSGMRFAVGICDGLPKLTAQRLLQPLLEQPRLRLVCHEDELEDLLAELALHRLDVILADRPAPANRNLKLYTHPLGASPVAWYAPPQLRRAARRGFPASLAQVPVLLPTGHAALRAQLDQWFERNGVKPRVAGEFEDSALLATFGTGGLGVFPASDLMREDLKAWYGVERVGTCDDVEERLYAIGTERKVLHPLVARLLAGAR
jgi:LysR family transcriptional activator of nhaA